VTQYVISKINIASLVLVFIIGFTLGGMLVIYLDLFDKPCKVHQMYVVDTDRCISVTVSEEP
jgi:hypothetical protein